MVKSEACGAHVMFLSQNNLQVMHMKEEVYGNGWHIESITFLHWIAYRRDSYEELHNVGDKHNQRILERV